MKTNISLFISLSLLIISCSTEPDTKNDQFLVKVDSIELLKTITLGDTLHISFYGTIGNNGGFSFERFESTVHDKNIDLKVWGKFQVAGAQLDVMVNINGRKFNYVPTNKGDYKIIVHQPDGTTIEETATIQ